MRTRRMFGDHPEGVKVCSQGRKPLGTVTHLPSSPNGAADVYGGRGALLPDVPFVKRYLMVVEKFEELLLEGHSAVMFGLGCNVPADILVT